MVVFALLAGIVIGAVIGYLFARSRLAAGYGPTAITGSVPEGQLVRTGQRICVRFATSSTSISTAFRSGPVREAGVTTTASFRRSSSGAAPAWASTPKSANRSESSSRSFMAAIRTGRCSDDCLPVV